MYKSPPPDVCLACVLRARVVLGGLFRLTSSEETVAESPMRSGDEQLKCLPSNFRAVACGEHKRRKTQRDPPTHTPRDPPPLVLVSSSLRSMMIQRALPPSPPLLIFILPHDMVPSWMSLCAPLSKGHDPKPRYMAK